MDKQGAYERPETDEMSAPMSDLDANAKEETNSSHIRSQGAGLDWTKSDEEMIQFLDSVSLEEEEQQDNKISENQDENHDEEDVCSPVLAILKAKESKGRNLFLSMAEPLGIGWSNSD